MGHECAARVFFRIADVIGNGLSGSVKLGLRRAICTSTMVSVAWPFTVALWWRIHSCMRAWSARRIGKQCFPADDSHDIQERSPQI